MAEPAVSRESGLQCATGAPLFGRRGERDVALLLDPTWSVPLALFTAVSDGQRQWLHAQPIQQ